MNEITEVLSIVGLFFLRIGVPLLILLVIGTLIDRAYRRREAQDTERPISVDMPMRTEQPQQAEQVVPATTSPTSKKHGSK